MPSFEETKRRVKENLDKQSSDERNHGDILASLQDEIDKHNAVKDDLRSTMRRSKRHETSEDRDSERSLKFRFKEGVEDPRRKRRRDHDEGDSKTHQSRRHRKNRRGEHYPTPPQDGEDTAAHPFPREPTSINDNLNTNQDEAFRTSLFDALADDEGAASYWENIYSQPIHTYPRPSQLNTSTGELEAMGDEEYVEYVKTKMWERKHPEIVREREKREKDRKVEEEERTRRREEFVRRRERAAWERAQGWGGDDREERTKSHGYEFAGEASRAPSEREEERQEYAEAWSKYLAAWDGLKYDLLTEQQSNEASSTPPSKRIPWPVLASKPVIKANIEAFMQHAPSDSARSKGQVLKAERVRWHPDKVQQRFRGAVDEGTMKLVTGVFQVVDAVFEEMVKSGS